MTCEEVRISLGAHALGALEPDEAEEIDTHLATCEVCGAELLELAGVGAFLGKVSERDVELVASPPRQVLDRLLNDRVRRTRRGRALLSVAGAAAVLVVGGTVWTATQTASDGGGSAAAPVSAQEGEPRMLRDQGSAESAQPFGTEAPAIASSEAPMAKGTEDPGRGNSRDSRAEARPTASSTQERDEIAFPGENAAGDHSATVLVRPAAAGSGLGVQVRGLPVDTGYRLVVVGVDGREERSPRWVLRRADYEKGTIFRSETTMTVKEIARFEIVDGAGRTLVTVTVPPTARGK
ncbi:zf-HC2 domain-containing protein [Nonomuraea sp. MG754425]|uniref:anti-sigma factor family protein n=1 Tax=Nonomuraea sp. MG754425 TaxID=2570319 RepID=UPI001F3749AD|nr:zf-HC2 domain-containing protein [Nonomuraea sp. MG754425]MCF6468877.1 zf-HC2 domain-containing protein [Nonomuraea sp. MG754425]